MTALLPHELGPFTIAHWHALPAREDGSRLELIEGYWLVTPPPSGQHQWAEGEMVFALKSAIRQAGRTDLFAVAGVGVEISTTYRTALVPDFVVLNTRPLANSFQASEVVLAGEIWSPGNSGRERKDKFAAYEQAGVPFFWSIAQDLGGPTELAAYRLEDGRYVCEATAEAGQGRFGIAACPVAVELDITALRP
ncbi:Uma2 family endonuclease [Saccharopolyspora erythraea]|nr:Uma2 family endonuclease [Saccharopolyspora erythraea]